MRFHGGLGFALMGAPEKIAEGCVQARHLHGVRQTSSSLGAGLPQDFLIDLDGSGNVAIFRFVIRGALSAWCTSEPGLMVSVG